MRMIIMGGGKIGSQIATDLDAEGHGVVVIEADHERADVLANSSEVMVVHGDGTDLGLLDELAIRRDDFFLALTGVDQDNLVACELVRVTYGTTRLLARLNDPKNAMTFDALDIPYVSVTSLLANIIAERLELAEMGQASLGSRSEMTFLTVLVPEDAGSQRIHDLELPPSTIVVALEDPSGIRVPNGDTTVKAGDRVVVLTRIGSEEAVADALRSRPR